MFQSAAILRFIHTLNEGEHESDLKRSYVMFKMSATSLSWSHSLSVHQPLLCRKVVLLTDFIKHYIQFQWHQLSTVYLTSLVFSVIGIKLNHILVLFLYFLVKFILVIKMFVFYHVSSKFT